MRHEKKFESAGFVILVLGLLFENRFQNVAQSAEADARSASERTVIRMQGDAKVADGKIADATRDAAKAQAEAASANERAGLANERAAKIEAAFAPRDIHAPKTFSLIMAGSRGQPIIVRSYAVDAEGGRLAAEVIQRLRGMGFSVADASLTDLAGQPPLAFGVYVSGPDSALVTSLLVWVNESALAGIEHDPPHVSASLGGESFTGGIPDATIFVGSKPLPPLPE